MRTFRFALLFSGLNALWSGAHAADPREFLPPILPWQGAGESLIVAPDHPWITPSEKTGLVDSPNYDDTIAWLRRLCDATPLVSMIEIGRTSQGRPLYVVIASRQKQHTPQALGADGKPTLLAQAGIHSGEIDGKDAGLMFLRDLALGDKSALLDEAHFLFIPVFNADGHERSSEWNRPNQRGPTRMGWRTTAQNLNLNRDYVKADSPEMRSLLSVLDAWSPSLYLDIHVTDGMDYQYDITFTHHGHAGNAAWSPMIGRWLDQSFSPAMQKALKSKGHIPLNFYVNQKDKNDWTRGLAAGHVSPRFSHGYGDLRHVPTVLIETHSLKPYRQRVLGVYVLLAAALEWIGRDGAALGAAIAADRSSRAAEVILTWEPGGPKRLIDFLGVDFEIYQSPASGAAEIRWLGRPKTYPNTPVFTDRPGIAASRPVAYWVPVTKPEVIDRLKLHGIRLETIDSPRAVQVEMYRLIDPQPAGADQPFESRHPVKAAGVLPEKRRQWYPAGSVRVPADQPLGDLAIAMLEPLCSDSLFAWGFFNEILQRTEYIEGYVIAPMAEKMLASDPALQAEFGAKLAADPAFAADPAARLKWFYTRTPFCDDRFLLYPVGIER